MQQVAFLYAATTDQIGLDVARGDKAPTAYLGAFAAATEELLKGYNHNTTNSATHKQDTQYKLGALCYLTANILPKVNVAVVTHLLERLATLFVTTLKRFAEINFIAKQFYNVSLSYYVQFH
eukprot:UN07706